ncbi:restriction endonuclease subunit S [Enterococcus faecium]|uniref:restriction endonuclease subunit S n=1 Tax=Enterococcus faecium TaxID=1352 RepID=UPI00288D2BD9|nr:restriction endonuclease subunit S [Enterococcus faecium]MDT2326559.1 restriction endonuclease subunit S [Enterococcus faecium]
MSNDTQPEIRFPGFTDEWEQRKLGELATIVRGASPRPIQDPKWFDTESDVGWLRIADVTEQDGRIYYLEQHISKLGQEKTRVLVEPHLLLSIAATVGKPVVNYVKTGVHDGFLIFLNAIFDREFMFQWLEMFRPKWQKYGQPGSQVNLNSELVRNQEILIPNNEEQQKIGSFFKQLDNTIALHQRKLDLLKETKKGFLQKMFPKNGAKVPEIRFPGFTEDWEERKLSELAEVKTGFPFKNDDFIDGGNYLVITNGNIQNNSALVDGNIGNRISAVSDEIKDKYLLNYGDILVTMDGTVGRTAKVFEKNQILAQRVGRLVANTTPEFLYQWLNTGKFFGDMTKVSHGGTIKHISLSEISDFNAFVPVNEDERVKIGSLLLNIDKTITLHQRKLDLLKEMKKGFLQKMFV